MMANKIVCILITVSYKKKCFNSFSFNDYCWNFAVPMAHNNKYLYFIYSNVQKQISFFRNFFRRNCRLLYTSTQINPLHFLPLHLNCPVLKVFMLNPFCSLEKLFKQVVCYKIISAEDLSTLIGSYI